MPPASPPPDQQHTADDFSPLSDEDVGILYQIITAAERDSNVEAHPFRAVFASYDTVLAQHGLNPDHDQIYLRFLLRLGGNRRTGETLYYSFEALLAELGIQIEINLEQDEIQDVTRSVDATARTSPQLRTRSQTGSESGIRSGRASSHTVADQRGDIGTNARVRSSSRTSMAGAQGDQIARTRDRPSTRASTRPSERSQHQQLANQPTRQPPRGRLTATEFASNLQHVQRRHASASATRTNSHLDRNTLPHRLRTRSNEHHSTQGVEDFSLTGHDHQHLSRGLEQSADGYDRGNQFSGDQGQAYHIDGRELFYQPTEAQLLRDADSFQQFRVLALTRKTLSRWRIAALDSRERNGRMDDLAQNFDLGILLRQSFDQWRGMFQLRMQAVATERYFAQLQQRAQRARDLYLMTKAFTHWQQITNDRIQRAVQARRHVLSIKYFNAWLELTVVNHRKVQLQGQKKFCDIWHRRYQTSIKTNHTASLARRHNLIKTAYWKWFWAFCEQRAPQWKARRLQTTVFNHWSTLSQRNLYREYEVIVRKDEAVKKASFLQWLQRTRSALSNGKAAETFHRQNLTARSILACRRALKFAPLIRQVANMVDWRVAGSTFAVLVNRVRTEQQAKKINQLRALRNAWTTWNDTLRWQTLEARIDDRVLVQALYRWVLAERCVLLQRLHEQRSTRLCLRNLVGQRRARMTTQTAALDDFEKKRRTRAAKLAIKCWRQTVDSCKEDANVALEFEAPRIAQEAISTWTEKMNHFRKIDKWADDASYYFRTVRFLKHWRAAAAEAKRRRYREAYTHIRRQNKIKIASDCLQIWRVRTKAIIDMQEQAHLNDQRQLVQYGISLFDRWRNRHGFLIERRDQVALESDRRFAHKQLDNWMVRYRNQAQFKELARVNAGLRISNMAFGWLHKLHLQVIELKGRENNAESLRRWYVKRHFHNLFRQWREELAMKVAEKHGRKQDRFAQRPVSTARAQRLEPRPGAEGEDEAAGRAEDWTEFDKDFDLGDWIPALEVQAGSTPVPGYLSTPSKRAARARFIAGMSTTPAGEPARTPSTFRLRTQLGRDARSVRRNELGRSGVDFIRSAFGPIQEASPMTP
ncbi:MAG: hypothetical protein Q9182_004452 [Xanthomendoza sp. 2 TL-2023]